MMQHLTNDPSFWVAFWALVGMVFTAAATLLGLLIAWAKAKTAEYEARDAKAGLAVTEKSIDRVTQAAGTMAAQVSTHSAQIAALQATNQGAGDGRQATVSAVPVAPATPVAPVAPASSSPAPAPAPAPEQTAAPLPTVVLPGGANSLERSSG